MKLILTDIFSKIVSFWLVNLLIIINLSSQNTSVCPIGVGMEPSVKVKSSTTSFANEIFFPQFMKWQDLGKIKFADDQKAKVVLPDFKRSRVMMGNNLNLQIPVGSTIDGIMLVMEGQSTQYQHIDELEVVLLDADGEPKGTNKANTAKLQKAWSTRSDGSDHMWMYGSQVDTWGASWTADELNNPNFGFQIQLRNIDQDTIEISMDRVEVIVYYTPLYSFCDANCLTFYIDKLEQKGSYVWHYPAGFDMVSASTSFQTIDLKITYAQYGIHEICVDVYNYDGTYAETCCRKFLYQNCTSSQIKGLLWVDGNNNKLRDLGEGVLDSVQVILYSEVGLAVDTVYSDINGKYLFDDIDVGKYFIKVPEVANHKMVLFDSTNLDLNSDITNANGLGTTDLIQTIIGECIEAIDFGYTPLISIGDYVWLDKNYNGLQDSTELGLENIKIFLYNETGSVLDSTFSNTSGLYSFDSLSVGKYQLGFGIPQDYLATFKNNSNSNLNSKIDNSGRTPIFTFNTAGPKNNVDAGFYQTAKLGDSVWEDKNGNGIQNNGELPLPNVDVLLEGTAGDGQPVSLQTKTNLMGRYGFLNVKPGNYKITFTAPNSYFFTLFAQGDDQTKDSDALNGVVENIMVCSGDLLVNFDAGLYRLGSISDFVWEDLNANGLQDLNESGLVNVSVSLVEIRRDEIIEIGTQITDENGYYIFDNLKPGVYRLTFTLPDGYFFSIDNVGLNDADDSDVVGNTIEDIMLMSGEDNNTYDAGMYRLASIGDFVWEDVNGNGIQDIGEPGIDGIALSLNGTSGDGNVVTSSAITDENGYYLFDDLVPGTYNINMTLPGGFMFSPSNQGSDNNVDSDAINGLIENINLISGIDDLSNDVGLVSGVTIGDFVWNDLNANGIQDAGEPGLANVNIQLSGIDFNGTAVNLNTTTDQNGAYSFSNIFVGSYTLTVDVPMGFISTLNMVGTDKNIDSDLIESGNTISFSVNNNNSDFSLDAGLIAFGYIGDFVWEDLNCNGIADMGEPGIADVLITLSGTDIFGNLVEMTTTTDAQGSYVFINVLAGSYTIAFTAPTGYESQLPTTYMVTVQNGQQINTIDAAFFRRGAIGDYVWNDVNEDGIQNENEVGIEGIKVTLTSLNLPMPVILETFTDGNGRYYFDNLKPAFYDIQFEIREGFQPTFADQDADDTKDSDIDDLGNVYEIEIISGKIKTDIDAGFISEAKAVIGDFVWEDMNGNGLQDTDEPGILGVKVLISGTAQNGSTLNAQVTTDNAGKYQFTNLPTGTYTLTFEAPQDYIFTKANVFGNEDIDSDADPLTGSTQTLIIGSNDIINNVDAGLYRYSTIGDFVWNDVNQNGLQDIGEAGIEGASLILRNIAGDEIANTISDASGFYNFNNLIPGTYTIKAAIPNGFDITIIELSTDALNSDFDKINNEAFSRDVILVSNTWQSNIDLGLISVQGSQSGFVWFDENGDGIKDNVEQNLDSILVYLLNDAGDTLAVDTTELAGFYNFPSLLAGTYSLIFDRPDSLLFTLFGQGNDNLLNSDVIDIFDGATANFVIANGQDKTDISAGLVGRSSIGDYVWIDTNENGLQDTDEEGLNGIVVKLYDQSGGFIDSTVTILNLLTGQSGFYSFKNLVYGLYSVRFSVLDNFSYSVINVTDSLINSDVVSSIDGSTAIFSVRPNGNRLDIDAGYVINAPLAGVIRGRVWQDANNNKLRDVSEISLSGVEVSLYEMGGTFVSSQLTDSDGTYTFSDIPFGDYYVSGPVMSDKVFVIYSGASVPLDSDISNEFGLGSTRVLNLFPGDTLNDIDLGYAEKITIGDFVWNDLNNNGLQDVDEPSLDGVNIQLIDEQGNIVQTTSAAANGFYQFDNVAVGRYSLQFSKPNGFTFVDQNPINQNLNSKADGNGLVTLREFLLVADYDNIDVGYVQTGSIGDRVWLDLNGNGLYQTNEPGIANILVQLFTETGILIDSTRTNVQQGNEFTGFYQFTNVKPDRYYVKFNIPSGTYIISAPNVGDPEFDNDITNSNGALTTNLFEVLPGQNITNIDAGAYQPATIGDRVWHDLNKDGIQDAGEPGVPDITVNLFSQSGITLATAVTDADGFYSFEGLRQRLYYLQFSLPDNFEFTLQYAGNSGALDSDVDITGTTPLISLAHGSTFLDVDAGIQSTTNRVIMGNVWNDANEDGVRTEDEKLSSLIDVQLRDINQNTLQTFKTNHAGMYAFVSGQQGGCYVQVSAPGDHVFTAKHMGVDPDKDSDVNVDGSSDMVILDNNYTMKYIDAGYYPKVTATLKGVAWFDSNGNGLRESNDSLMSNVLILIFNKFHIFVKSVKTDAFGKYELNNLDPGQYYCKVPEYGGKKYILFTGANQDRDSEITNQYGTGTTRLLTLGGATTVDNFDFGYARSSNFTDNPGGFMVRNTTLSIHPNPAFDYIDVVSDESESAIYYIANNQGSIILKGTIIDGNARINIENLPSGKYSLHLVSARSKIVKSFIKIDQ